MTRTTSLPDLSGQALRYMTSFLFRPFRWSLWWRLALIVWLSGYMVGGGFSFRYSLPSRTDAGKAVQMRGEQKEPSKPAPTYSMVRERVAVVPAWIATHKAAVALGVLLLIGFMVFMSWLASRMSFVFVHSVTAGTANIQEPFTRFAGLADSYWVFRLGLSVLQTGMAVGILWWAVSGIGEWGARAPDVPLDRLFTERFQELIPLFVRVLSVGAMLGLLGGVLGAWLSDYVIPVMFRRSCGVFQGWKESLGIIGDSPWEAVKYLLWRALMRIAAAVCTGLAGLGLLLALVIVGILIALLGALLVSLVPAVKSVLIVVGISAIVILVLAVVLFSFLAMVPSAVFLRSLSLLYLGSLGKDLSFFPDASSS